MGKRFLVCRLGDTWMRPVELIEKYPEGTFRIVTDINRHFTVLRETPVIILKLSKLLQDKFGFEARKPVSALEETVIVCTRADIELLLGWDNSSGFFIKGRNKHGEACTADLVKHLVGLFDEPTFEGYIRPL